jgi:sugar phosphate isomerase/epimerase
LRVSRARGLIDAIEGWPLVTNPDMTVRLSCGDHSFPLVPHELALDLIATLGFEGLNLVIWGTRSEVRPDQVQDDVARWAGRLEERVRSRGLEFADVVCIPANDYATLALNHPDPAERERSFAFFEDMLEFTARLGAPGLTMLPGIDWPHEGHEDSLARAAEVLPARIEAARGRGVGFSIEPHLGSVCQTPADAAWLCEAAPGLELTLDYTHFVAQGFEEVDVDSLLAQTRHIHARGGASGRLQVSFADNSIDYERIVDLLREADYEGFVAVEYVWHEAEGLNEVDVLSETVILRDRLQALLAHDPRNVPVPERPTQLRG